MGANSGTLQEGDADQALLLRNDAIGCASVVGFAGKHILRGDKIGWEILWNFHYLKDEKHLVWPVVISISFICMFIICIYL